MPKRGDFLLTVDKLVNTSIGGDLKLFFGKDEKKYYGLVRMPIS